MVRSAVRTSVVFTLFAAVVLFTALPCEASDFAFSGWQMADADGVVNLPIRLSTLADPRVFDYMPALTSDWYPCSSPTQINWYTSSNCTAYVQAYYKYFRTYLYVSGAMAGQSVHIRADGHIDDVVNIVVNGANTGKYLPNFSQADWRQVNITSDLNFGQVNEILFRFADTAALQRGITQVSIRTGTGTVATYDPTVGGDQVTITSIGAAPLVLPAGGGTTQCSMAATDSLGHAFSCAWTASSSLGAGTFDDPTSPTPTWTSPANNTGSDVTATLTVTATCSQGQSAQASVGVVIPPAAPGVHLQISMRLDSGTENTVKPGEPYRYWISYSNKITSTADALEVIVQDDLPENTTYVARSAQAGWAGATAWFSTDGTNWLRTEPADAAAVRFVRWTMPRLTPGQGALACYQVRGTPPDDAQLPMTIVNDASMWAANALTPVLSAPPVLTRVTQPREVPLRLDMFYRDEQDRTIIVAAENVVATPNGLSCRLLVTNERGLWREVTARLGAEIRVSLDPGPWAPGAGPWPWILPPDGDAHAFLNFWGRGGARLFARTDTDLATFLNVLDILFTFVAAERMGNNLEAVREIANLFSSAERTQGFQNFRRDFERLQEACQRGDWGGTAATLGALAHDIVGHPGLMTIVEVAGKRLGIEITEQVVNQVLQIDRFLGLIFIADAMRTTPTVDWVQLIAQ